MKRADKICNLRDILATPPADWDRAHKQQYLAWASEVGAGLRGVNPPLERIVDPLLARRDEIG